MLGAAQHARPLTVLDLWAVAGQGARVQSLVTAAQYKVACSFSSLCIGCHSRCMAARGARMLTCVPQCWAMGRPFAACQHKLVWRRATGPAESRCYLQQTRKHSSTHVLPVRLGLWAWNYTPVGVEPVNPIRSLEDWPAVCALLCAALPRKTTIGDGQASTQAEGVCRSNTFGWHSC